MSSSPGDERAYEELNKLLEPNELKPFVEQHPEFAWCPAGKKGMIITWGRGGWQFVPAGQIHYLYKLSMPLLLKGNKSHNNNHSDHYYEC